MTGVEGLLYTGFGVILHSLPSRPYFKERQRPERVRREGDVTTDPGYWTRRFVWNLLHLLTPRVTRTHIAFSSTWPNLPTPGTPPPPSSSSLYSPSTFSRLRLRVCFVVVVYWTLCLRVSSLSRSETMSYTDIHVLFSVFITLTTTLPYVTLDDKIEY